MQRDATSMEEVSILLGHSLVFVTEARYALLERRPFRNLSRAAQKAAQGQRT
jgi:hypothetical protein